MVIPPIPKRWLIHDMIYREAASDNGFGDFIYAEPVLIKRVRHEQWTEFRKIKGDSELAGYNVIFVDATNSSPVPEFKVKSMVEVNGVEYRILKVITLYHPVTNKVRHYELEVE